MGDTLWNVYILVTMAKCFLNATPMVVGGANLDISFWESGLNRHDYMLKNCDKSIQIWSVPK